MRTQFLSRSHRNRLRYSLADDILGTEPDNLIQLLTLGETGGAVAYDLSPQRNNGAYTAVTLNQPGLPGGRFSSALFDGSTSYVNAHSAGLAADFDGDQGTICVWIKVSAAGVWTDGTIRYFFRSAVDANNLLYIFKNSTNNTIQYNYRAGGTAKAINKGSVSSVDWLKVGMTWNATADEAKYYLDTELVSTQTELGTWAGSIVNMIIGASSLVPADVHSGYAAMWAIWNKTLTKAQLDNLTVN